LIDHPCAIALREWLDAAAKKRTNIGTEKSKPFGSPIDE